MFVLLDLRECSEETVPTSRPYSTTRKLKPLSFSFITSTQPGSVTNISFLLILVLIRPSVLRPGNLTTCQPFSFRTYFEVYINILFICLFICTCAFESGCVCMCTSVCLLTQVPPHVCAVRGHHATMRAESLLSVNWYHWYGYSVPFRTKSSPQPAPPHINQEFLMLSNVYCSQMQNYLLTLEWFNFYISQSFERKRFISFDLICLDVLTLNVCTTSMPGAFGG